MGQFRLWCEDEKGHVYVAGAADDTPPKACPNDAGHKVRLESITYLPEAGEDARVERVAQDAQLAKRPDDPRVVKIASTDTLSALGPEG